MLMEKCLSLQRELLPRLLEYRDEQGVWRGCLSSSPLATGLALLALRIAGEDADRSRCEQAVNWLAAMQRDGGWGDTTSDRPNVTATLLITAALAGEGDAFRLELPALAAELCTASRRWLQHQIGGLDFEKIMAYLKETYGDDLTFAAPIAMVWALSRESEDPDCWKYVPALPCELVFVPRSWYQSVRLAVVSYALPALIAAGYLISQRKGGVRYTFLSRLRSALFRRLERLQPANGGFLEATPLTAFVVMALAAAGERDHIVLKRGLGFLREQMRDDGSWPIDSDLACWLTSFVLRALDRWVNVADSPQGLPDLEPTRAWLVQHQFRRKHPFTGAKPGGWGWTDLPGSVPDADDTAAAMIALAGAPDITPMRPALLRAHAWLLDLQNSDGGIPTFCRGWGQLPFDRSSCELTAHVMRAWEICTPWLPSPLRYRTRKAQMRAKLFLEKQRRPEGGWHGLWFGSQQTAGGNNPVFISAVILFHLNCLQGGTPCPELEPAVCYLIRAQHESGGWGADLGLEPSTEETGAAVAALAGYQNPSGQLTQAIDHAVQRGIEWLILNATRKPPADIGLYFASLWYHEVLYPLIWAVEAVTSTVARELRKKTAVEATG